MRPVIPNSTSVRNRSEERAGTVDGPSDKFLGESPPSGGDRNDLPMLDHTDAIESDGIDRDRIRNRLPVRVFQEPTDKSLHRLPDSSIHDTGKRFVLFGIIRTHVGHIRLPNRAYRRARIRIPVEWRRFLPDF